MSKKSDDCKAIVIVGGGAFGSALARNLSGKLDPTKFNLSLITSRCHYIHLIAATRFTVTAEGNLEDTALIPYDKLLLNGNGTIVFGTATSIQEKGPAQGGDLILDNGESVWYDVLVLATGTIWSGPLDFPVADADVRAFINQSRKKYEAAREIVLVGGGAVGIETAGEIRDTFPNKKVTIVHGGDLLLNNVYPKRFRRDVERRVRERNIDIILRDYIDAVPEDGTVGLRTRNGVVFPNADLTIPTFGGSPNTKFISSLGSDILDARGFVKVDCNLQVAGHPGVFAMGDIIDWKEQKQATKVSSHISVVQKNIIAYLSGQEFKAIYKGAMEMIFIPIGKNHGAAYVGILWGIILGNWVVRTLKGSDLLISSFRKRFGFNG